LPAGTSSPASSASRPSRLPRCKPSSPATGPATGFPFASRARAALSPSRSPWAASPPELPCRRLGTGSVSADMSRARFICARSFVALFGSLATCSRHLGRPCSTRDRTVGMVLQASSVPSRDCRCGGRSELKG
jgi:hypothetical protein